MNTTKACLVSSATLAAFLLAGCGQKNATTETPAAAPSPAAAPAAAAAKGPRVDLVANDTMKYNITAIEATPGEDLTITLTNAGSLPKETMEHNWVLLKPGSDANAFSLAGAAAKATDYMPASLQDEVIAHIDMQGPHQTGQVEFKAPTAPGDYTYLCTFPAHYQVGMKGILTVK